MCGVHMTQGRESDAGVGRESPYWGGVLPPSWKTLLFLTGEHGALWWLKGQQADCSLTGQEGAGWDIWGRLSHSLHFSGEGQAHMGSGSTGRFRAS